MQVATVHFDRFNRLSDDEARFEFTPHGSAWASVPLSSAITINAPTYFRHADITGDSLKLSRLAAQSDADYIVFCGVHFMAEVADVLSRPEQVSILPDLAAGCSMADMANLAKVERCWRELAAVLDPDELITPVTYINSAADLKAFCGNHGGIVCTSSNAGKILDWSFPTPAEGTVLPRPAPRGGGPDIRWASRSTRCRMESRPRTWRPDCRSDRRARIILVHGYCSVHQMFQPAHIENFRRQFSRWQGDLASGMRIRRSVGNPMPSVPLKPSSAWSRNRRLNALAGRHRNFNLVERLAGEVRSEDKIVQFMSPTVFMCSNDAAHRSATPRLVSGESGEGTSSIASASQHMKQRPPKSQLETDAFRIVVFTAVLPVD